MGHVVEAPPHGKTLLGHLHAHPSPSDARLDAFGDAASTRTYTGGVSLRAAQSPSLHPSGTPHRRSRDEGVAQSVARSATRQGEEIAMPALAGRTKASP